MRPSRKHAVLIFVLLAGSLLSVFALTRCGSVIQGNFNGNGKSFDFSEPPCRATIVDPPAASIDIRYLGSGGAYIGWGDDAVLLGPFFSNPGLLAAAFGKFATDHDRIRNHLRDVPVRRVRAILIGHSHYDHIADLPAVARDYAPGSRIYANASGVNMLAAYPDLRDRTEPVDPGHPISIRNLQGSEVMRIYPVRSDHAPQVCAWRTWPCEYANCAQKTAWTTPFEDHRLNSFCGGQTYAYVIDLLRDGQVQYRVYYNDAAAESPLGIPNGIENPQRGYDVALLCMPSYDFVKGYPEVLVSHLNPRHLILTHYENFFSRSEGHWRFAPLLTNSKANAFFKRLRAIDYQSAALAPAATPCGVTTDRWTMPVPGAQVLFDKSP